MRQLDVARCGVFQFETWWRYDDAIRLHNNQQCGDIFIVVIGDGNEMKMRRWMMKTVTERRGAVIQVC